MSEPLKVLIVDDEPDIELLVRQRFKRRPGEFEFAFARNGREALTRLQEDPELDLVVTDINMPVMDGLALLGRIDGFDGRVIRAVILSAYGDMQNIRAAMNRGAFDFLTKPIDFRDFETTLRRTREAIESAREGLSARERLLALEQELEIAAGIQSSILPSQFLPDRPEIDIHAEMAPAHRVGGDFYDFFFIDERRLGFLIGDVAGKGVPAALFMAVSRTLLRATALQGVAPGEALEYANEVLGGQGDAAVFVTVFYGILDVESGVLEYAIGGHNPPYRVRESGEMDAIAEPAGMVVGLLPQAVYETGKMRLEPGDAVVLFTDGVTEAQDAEGKFFGERRLRETLRSAAGEGAEAMSRAVLTGCRPIRRRGRAQSDDVTLMAVRWTPPRRPE